MEIPIERFQSQYYQEQYQKQFPLCEKILYSLVIILFCLISIFLIATFGQNEACGFATKFVHVLNYIFYFALILRVCALLMLLLSYISKIALLTSIIYEQKMNEAEFFLSIVFILFGLFAYGTAEECSKIQLSLALIFIMLYVQIKWICLPSGTIDYFQGDFL